MKRRKFIFIATASVTTVAITTWYYNYSGTEYDKSLTKPQLLSNIWDAETIAEIGQLYQKKYPNENSEQQLVKLLSESTSTENGTIAESIGLRIKEDYKTGKIVTVDGWILSTTEARQCALFSLIQPK